MSKQKIFALVSSDVTLDKLQHIADTEERTIERPSHLKPSQVHVADMVFQPRVRGENIVASLEHIEELARVLRTQGKPLDPILVTPVGNRFFVVDGHHRLSAYRAVEWTKPIPVEVLDVSLKEARERAIALNIKNKLPMTSNDKFELAWTLVKTEQYSKSKIVEMTTVSERTVGNMRRVFASLKGKDNDVADMSWRFAKRLHADPSSQDYAEWMDKAANELAEKMRKLGVQFTKKPDVLARALEVISPSLPDALINQWLPLAIAIVEDYRETQNEEREESGFDI